MPSSKAKVGSVAISNLRITHQRVVEAQIAVHAWRTIVDIVGTGNPGYQAAEKEAADANMAWEALLRSL